MMQRRTFLLALAGLVVTRKWQPASVSEPPVVASYGVGRYVAPEAPMPQWVMVADKGLGPAPVGSVMAYFGEVADGRLLPCDGRKLSSREYPDLYAALQGDRIPDLRNRFPVSAHFENGWTNA